MTTREVWVSIAAVIVVLALVALTLAWATSSQQKEDNLRGGVPQMSRSEIQEFATARWWKQMSPDEQVETCLNLVEAGENTFKILAKENDLNPDQLWRFIERKCDL